MAKCRDCGLEIGFRQEGGRWRPTNPDSSDHFDVCSAERSRLMVAEGTPFRDAKGNEGYHWRGKPVYTHISGEWLVGSDYDPCPFCTVPPWDECDACPKDAEARHVRDILDEPDTAPPWE